MNRVNALFWIVDNIQNVCFFIDGYFVYEYKLADYVYVRNFYKL